MNDKKQNLNSENNGHAGRTDQAEADRFVEALETDPRAVGSLDRESRAIADFGADIRGAVEMDLPPANEKLRESILERLEVETELKPTLPTRKVDNSKPTRWLTPGKMAMAACVLLAATVGMLLPVVQPVREAARVSLVGDSTAKAPTVNDSTFKAGAVVEVAPGDDGSEGEGFDERVNGSTSREVAQRDKQYPIPEDASEGFKSDSKKLSEKQLDLHSVGPTSVHSHKNQSAPVPMSDQSGPGSGRQILNEDVQQNGILGQQSGQQAVQQNFLKLSDGDMLKTLEDSDGDGVVVGGVVEGADSLGFNIAGGRGGAGGGGRGGGRGGSGEGDRFARFQSEGLHYYFGLERSSGEQYDPIHENSFAAVKGQQALSTFSIDVDTASYSNMRRFLSNRQLPPRHSIRIEELVNYFEYDYPQPQGDTPFSVNMELASCPWNEQHHLLRVGLKGKEIHREERSPSNLVFLLDVSGSMQNNDKLPLLKKGLTMMVQRLTENDTVSVVTYAGNAGVVLNPTNGTNKQQIEDAIEQLRSGGSTNGSAGIQLAYELAQQHFIKGGANRVILATDGDLNVGVTSDSALVNLIKEKASEGVFLTVLGFGTGNLKDSKLEKLADNGNGMYAYIDNFREAHKVLIEQMSGSLETIAKDVKIQIEFNPGEVLSYRLIGYENRMLAAKDFADDKKDAGEIGAGHSVTALYELQLNTDGKAMMASGQPLRYQDQPDGQAQPGKSNEGASEKVGHDHAGEILTLSLRYKKPDESESQKIQFALKDEPKSFSSASGDFQFAAAVASFGMLLRNSSHRGTASLDWIEAIASRNVGDDVAGHRVEFVDLVRKASSKISPKR